jgi:hypothetical protein
MTDIHERRISHKELFVLSFRCTYCSGELTVDFTNQDQRARLLRTGDEFKCPFCDEPFPRYLRESFRAFREWRDKLEAWGQELTFRIPISGTEASPREPSA